MMLSFLQGLLSACLLPICCAQAVCPTGWFGENCMYKCRCSNSPHCEMDGRCPDRCQAGYFGPGCQYVDLCYTKCKQEVPGYLRDNDDDTCNTNQRATSVVLTTTELLHISWFRIVFRSSTNLLNFNLTINEYLGCFSQRKLRVSPTIVDVTCDNQNRLQKLEITGQKVADICSVYISGGRNVALMQQARQSSMYTGGSYSGLPSNVVDGNDQLIYDSCSRTSSEPGPWWEVTYNRPQVLTKIIIHTLNDEAVRLSHFRVATLKFHNITNLFVTDSNVPDSVYEFTIMSEELVTSVRVSQVTGSVLRLCEVETLGETMCPDNSYGLYCQHNCSCAVYQSCSVVNGECFTSCRDRVYGFKCTLSCDSRCYLNRCYPRSGQCYSCSQDGAEVPCTPVCIPGTYGPICQSSCSQYCSDTCDSATGNCVCQSGHVGARCTECPPGTSGESCLGRCPATCKDSLCDPLTGLCLACPDGRFGPLCDQACPGTCTDNKCYRDTGLCVDCRMGVLPHCNACRTGYYGEMCDLACPKTCRDNECNEKTGVCLSCKTGVLPYCGECPRGKYGRTCDKECPSVCQHGACTAKNGSCFSCKNDRLPPNCQVCRRGRHGSNCELTCPSVCKNSVCDMNTGACLACEPDLIPPDCKDSVSSSVNLKLLWILAVLVGIFLVIMIAALVWVFTKQPVEVADEKNKQDKTWTAA